MSQKFQNHLLKHKEKGLVYFGHPENVLEYNETEYTGYTGE